MITYRDMIALDIPVLVGLEKSIFPESPWSAAQFREELSGVPRTRKYVVALEENELIGYAGIADLDVSGVQLWLDDVWVAKDGGRHPDYKEEDGQRVMKKAEIKVKANLGRGTATQTVWTCDLSHEYVSINADYRS